MRLVVQRNKIGRFFLDGFHLEFWPTKSVEQSKYTHLKWECVFNFFFCVVSIFLPSLISDNGVFVSHRHTVAHIHMELSLFEARGLRESTRTIEIESECKTSSLRFSRFSPRFIYASKQVAYFLQNIHGLARARSKRIVLEYSHSNTHAHTLARTYIMHKHIELEFFSHLVWLRIVEMCLAMLNLMRSCWLHDYLLFIPFRSLS